MNTRKNDGLLTRVAKRLAALGLVATLLLGGAQAALAGTARGSNVNGPVRRNPVAGSNGTLNARDRSRGQGDGRYGTPRAPDRRHNGIDIRGKSGTPIVAASRGRVIYSGDAGGRTGNAVVLSHGKGRTTHYYHLEGSHQPKVGTRVNEGERIGTLGRSGNVPRKADSHLHYEERKNGVPVRPKIDSRRGTGGATIAR